jgi:hypothetical protein
MSIISYPLAATCTSLLVGSSLGATGGAIFGATYWLLDSLLPDSNTLVLQALRIATLGAITFAGMNLAGYLVTTQASAALAASCLLAGAVGSFTAISTISLAALPVMAFVTLRPITEPFINALNKAINPLNKPNKKEE